MPSIVWIKEDGQPRILGILDKSFASSGSTQQHTYTQFEKIVGRGEAEAALGRYYREQDSVRRAT